MDTKSKNIKYSNGLKFIAVIVVVLSAIGIVGGIIFLSEYQDEAKSDKYFETQKFNKKYINLIYNIVQSKLVLKNENNIRETYDDENVWYYINRFKTAESRLSDNVNLLYYVKDNKTNLIYTNTTNNSKLKLLEHPISNYLNSLFANNYTLYSYLGADIEEMLENKDCEVYITMSDPLKPGDDFYDDYQTFLRIKEIYEAVFITLIASIILLIISFIYLICVSGRNKKDEEIKLLFIDKVFIEVQTAIVLIIALISLRFVRCFDLFPINIYDLSIIIIIFGLDVLVGLTYILSITRLIKKRQFLKSMLLYRLFTKLKKIFKLCFSGKVFKAWILILFIAYEIINTVLYHRFLCGYSESFVIIILLNIVVIYFVFKFLTSLSTIMKTTKAISDGNLDYKIDTSKISNSLLDFSNNIQNIRDGMKNAVNRAVKGEQMKTALITNVSHDLKTPLTSIITYVDLLKKEELSNEKAVEYVNILDEKSNRLKKLIEDLIEASKASSGNITVQQEKVNLNELIMQACGEYEDKIKLSNLDIRINADENQTFIYADSKAMWRIVENLLVNVFKYSVSNSRVYIDIEKKENFGVLTIKNISANPLNISAEQLTERFVRGDEARTTEGSGLGLSIAQSLSTLQNGKFDINIDGDLFKAIVSMPLWTEN